MHPLVGLAGVSTVTAVTSVGSARQDDLNLGTFKVMIPYELHFVVVFAWGETLMSGQAALRAILILSDSEEVAAKAQQLPQYVGRC